MEAGTARIWRLAVLASLAAHVGIGTVLITLSPVSAGGTAGGPLNFDRMYLLTETEARDELTLTPPEQAPDSVPVPPTPPLPPMALTPAPPAPPPEPMKVPLGAEAGLPHMTPAWLAGMGEGEHAARMFENDQPQLDRVNKDVQGGAPGAAGQDGDNGSPAGAAPVSPAVAKPENKAREARAKQDEAPDLNRPMGPDQEEVKIGSAGGPAPERELAPTAPRAQEKVTPQEQVDASPAVPPIVPAPQTPSPAVTDAQDANSGPGGKPGAPGAPGNPGTTPKVAADRESDATSIKAAAVYRNGRVLASEGLDIKTVRPEFSLTTQTLRTPESPVLRILFGRDGRVREVKIIKSSGYPEAVDGPVVSAAYNWRAAGKILASLPNHPSASLSLEITIVLQ